MPTDARHAPHAPTDAPTAARAAASTRPPTGVNLAALLERIHGNQDVMGQLVDMMLTHLPKRLDAIDAAINAADTEALSSAAHSLKGSLSNFTQGHAWLLVGALEQSARDGELAGATTQAAEVRDAVADVQRELEAWRSQR